jgi:hypothetical protein
MKSNPTPPQPISADDEYAQMLGYAKSLQGRSKIAVAEAEIAAGLGIVADDGYFSGFRARRKQGRSAAG